MQPLTIYVIHVYHLQTPRETVREILFTVLKREDKYKVKSVTDTLGYRTGDQLGA